MNNEIKEINIKIPGQILDYVDTKEHLLDLFNYITNLQVELQEANDNADWWYNRFKAVQQENERLKEKIDQLINNWNELEEFLESNWIDTQDIWYVKIINKMKEIKNSN